jgi:hypothetical protein
VKGNGDIVLHVLSLAVLEQIEEKPERVERQITATVDEIQPSLRYHASVSIADDYVGHVLQDAARFPSPGWEA